MNYDFVSLGRTILESLVCADENAIDVESVGKDFYEWLVDKNDCEIADDFQLILRRVFCKQCNREVFTWFLQTDVFNDNFVVLHKLLLTFHVSSQDAGVMANVSVFRNCHCIDLSEDRRLSKDFNFDQIDTTGLLNNFVYLHQFVACDHGLGYKAMQMLQQECNNYSIKGCIGFIFAGDYEHACVDDEYWDKKFDSLRKFYQGCGFLDVNAISGFEEEISIIWLCDADSNGIKESSRITDTEFKKVAWKMIDELQKKRYTIKAF